MDLFNITNTRPDCIHLNYKELDIIVKIDDSFAVDVLVAELFYNGELVRHYEIDEATIPQSGDIVFKNDREYAYFNLGDEFLQIKIEEDEGFVLDYWISDDECIELGYPCFEDFIEELELDID